MLLRISARSKELEAAHELEYTILSERREDLLWRATHDERHYRQKNVALTEGHMLAKRLHEIPFAVEDAGMIAAIEENFAKFDRATRDDGPVSVKEMSLVADGLLKAVENYREQVRIKMLKNLEEGERLDALIDRWSQAVLFLATLLVIAGSYALIRRIVEPSLALTRTAMKFGKGDFAARARVYREDELGMLCRTFNDMAESICSLEQDRQNFVATVAHDLKNPLIVIGAAARLLTKNISLSDPRSAWLTRITERVQYLESMIHDLVDSVQIETGRFSLQLDTIDLAAIVRGIYTIQNDLIKTHRIVFEGECECWIKGDKRRLERVVANLISNAIKYSPENTTVLLSVERHEANALVVVKDEGVGISQDEIRTLFRPFRRLSRTSGAVEGSGLGLFSVRKIVEGHGGIIRISSESGKGTTVEVLFPLCEVCA